MSTQNNNNGGPAFPNFQFTENGKVEICPQGGMSLRDYFAAKAMAGMLSNKDTEARNIVENSVAQSHLAQIGYAIADAMLAARKEVTK